MSPFHLLMAVEAHIPVPRKQAEASLALNQVAHELASRAAVGMQGSLPRAPYQNPHTSQAVWQVGGQE